MEEEMEEEEEEREMRAANLDSGKFEEVR